MPVTVDTTQIKALARRLAVASQNVAKDFAYATADISRASATETKRAAAKQYAVPQARIAEDVKVSSANAAVSIRAAKKGITLLAYSNGGAIQGVAKNGVLRVTVKRGKRRVAKSVFLPPKFKGVPFKRKGKSRYPIKVLYGASVADMLNDESVFRPLGLALSGRAERALVQRLKKALING